MSRTCSCGRTKAHHGHKPRVVMTSSGEVKLSRIYFLCVACGDGGFAADARLGIHGRYSLEAERLVCLAAASWSYDISSDRLTEFCGLQIGDTAIREISQRRGAAMNAWQNPESEACREFRDSAGEVEFTTDGTSVNTTEGWREMKLAIFSKRELGEGATPEEWATRTLPAPKVRVAVAAIEASDRFGSRWSQWRRRLGILDTSCITVLADGARWIWEEQLNHLPAGKFADSTEWQDFVPSSTAISGKPTGTPHEQRHQIPRLYPAGRDVVSVLAMDCGRR